MTPVIADRLHKREVRTIRDVARMPEDDLAAVLARSEPWGPCPGVIVNPTHLASSLLLEAFHVMGLSGGSDGATGGGGGRVGAGAGAGAGSGGAAAADAPTPAPAALAGFAPASTKVTTLTTPLPLKLGPLPPELLANTQCDDDSDVPLSAPSQMAACPASPSSSSSASSDDFNSDEGADSDDASVASGEGFGYAAAALGPAGVGPAALPRRRVVADHTTPRKRSPAAAAVAFIEQVAQASPLQPQSPHVLTPVRALFPPPSGTQVSNARTGVLLSAPSPVGHRAPTPSRTVFHTPGSALRTPLVRAARTPANTGHGAGTPAALTGSQARASVFFVASNVPSQVLPSPTSQAMNAALLALSCSKLMSPEPVTPPPPRAGGRRLPVVVRPAHTRPGLSACAAGLRWAVDHHLHAVMRTLDAHQSFAWTLCAVKLPATASSRSGGVIRTHHACALCGALDDGAVHPSASRLTSRGPLDRWVTRHTVRRVRSLLPLLLLLLVSLAATSGDLACLCCC